MVVLQWLVVALLTFLLFVHAAVAATTVPTQAEQDAWPEWVFAPSSDYPDTHLYGLGFGSSKAIARQQALAEIALQISADVQVLQRSTLTSSANQFEQSSTLEALGVQLEQIEEQQSAYLSGSNGAEFAVLLAVTKSAIIESVRGQIQGFESLSFPYDDETAQLLWALQYRQQLIDALRVERAMAALGGGEPMLRLQLEQLLNDVQSVWQIAGVRVIAERQLTPLVAGLNAQLPSAPTARLWLRLTQKKQTARQGEQFFERRELVVHVSPANSPTNIVQQQTLRALGQGATPSAATLDAEQQLLDLLNRPLSVWLFQ